MVLSDKQCEDLYKQVTKDSENLKWIKERLEKGDNTFGNFDSRLRTLEQEQSIIKGKLGAFVLGLTLFVTVIVNGILWLFSHMSGGK